MKKSVLVLLSILVCAVTINIASAKVVATSPATSAGIKLYKAGNYSQAYIAFQDITQKDPANALAYYYLAMSSAQLGKRDDAIANYEKAISLSPNGLVGKYARKGKTCIEDPIRCNEPEASTDTAEDRFIKSSYGSGFSEEARGVHENQKIQNLMREMNRNNEIAPQKFKEYRDFSSQAPTDEEIVHALRTLQSAGFGNVIGNGGYSDISLLTGGRSNNGYDMLNLLYGNGNTSASLSPQVIQSLLTNQMTAGF